MTKSGCCWHGSSEYIIKDGKPFVVKIMEDDAFGIPYRFERVYSWNGEEMELEETKYLNQFAVNEMFSFVIDQNDKVINLVTYGESFLYYCLLKSYEGEVEFGFPEISADAEGEQDDSFTYTEKEGNISLSFSNAWATYTIYETDKTVGIDVLMKGKVYNMSGRKDTQVGSLSKLMEFDEMDNVIFK